LSFDLSWLWETLNSIVSTIESWFSSLWEQAQNITNTGQGIFSGLIAFGTQLWDAITKFGSTVGDAFKTAFDYIKQGLENASNVLGGWINSAFGWIGSGVAFLGQQVYNFGAWIWSGINTLANWFVNALTTIWNNIVNWFYGLTDTLNTWWSGVTSTVNSWWTNLMISIRNKIKQTVLANITIMYAWKGGERILTAKSIKDMGLGVLGLALSPITGAVVGSIVDAVIPTPSTAVFPLIPEVTAFTYSPPTVEVTPPPPAETPAPPTIPEAGTPPAIPGWVISLIDKTASIETSYTVNWLAGKDLTASINTSYETIIS